MDERSLKTIEFIANSLESSFDNVQMFASKFSNSGDNVKVVPIGRGDLFARVGQVSNWIEQPIKYKYNKSIFDKYITELKKHYDSCQIFVSKWDEESNQTLSYEAGFGNIFSIRVSAEIWISNVMEAIMQPNNEGEDED